MNNNQLDEAKKLINEKIAAHRAELQMAAGAEEQDPVLLEGETTAGYYCQMMVDPAEAAPILLRHDYSIYKVLGIPAPEALWHELATHYGLGNITSIDL